jgi:hypothetical protein
MKSMEVLLQKIPLFAPPLHFSSSEDKQLFVLGSINMIKQNKNRIQTI